MNVTEAMVYGPDGTARWWMGGVQAYLSWYTDEV
jgi:hypothetical protein